MPVIGFAIILTFLVAGELLSTLMGHFMPGSVLGMLLLYLALCCKLIRPEWIRQTSEFLTKNMTVLFLPSAIGIIEQWGLIRTNIVTWVVIMVVCWLLVFASAGWTHQAISKIKKR